MTRLFLPVLTLLLFASCHSSNKATSLQNATGNQEKFWQSLQALCGNAYKGTVVAAPITDTTFKGKTLVMHVLSCEPTRIRIPFFVGEDRSRTWVFTKTKDQLSLKHDHRHQDGKPDSVTQYGGHTVNNGLVSLQMFPADPETAHLLPAAANNVWWIEVVPGQYFTYNLRRIGTERFFSIRFDLTTSIVKPNPPWGWKE